MPEMHKSWSTTVSHRSKISLKVTDNDDNGDPMSKLAHASAVVNNKKVQTLKI